MTASSRECIAALERLFKVEFVQTTDQLREAQRLRYQVFCCEHDILPSKDGYEADEYDLHSHHILLRRRDGEVVGTVRLVRALPDHPEKSFPMQRVCDPDHLRDLPLARTGEISRFSISRERRDMNSRTDLLLRLALMRGVLAVSIDAGITHWCAAMEKSLLRLLRQASVHFEPVGPVIDYRGLRQPAVGSIAEILRRGRAERPEFWDYVTDHGRMVAPGETARTGRALIAA